MMTSDKSKIPIGMQLTLFDCGAPPRPREYDKRVIDQLVEWYGGAVCKCMGFGPRDRDDALEELRDAFENETDPESIVDFLDENYYWQIKDLDTVLRDAWDTRNRIVKSLTKDWVLQNGVLPEYSVGQRVMLKTTFNTTLKTIVKVDVEHATYTLVGRDSVHTWKAFYEEVGPER